MAGPIGLVGFGKMGAAMVHAWQESGQFSAIDILDPNIKPQDLSHIARAKHFTNDDEFLSRAKEWDALILAVKPQTLDILFGDASTLPHNLLIISILAGKTIADLSQKFGVQQPIIRAMPNTPALVGQGMTCAISGRAVTPIQKEFTQTVMSAFGIFEWAKSENDMDAITALSGSGPSYVFYMIECMAQAGIAAGLEPEFAMTLARQTVIGAAVLAEAQSHEPASILRQNVTSPNGTTAAGLAVLMDGKFQDIITKTIARACARSKELSSS